MRKFFTLLFLICGYFGHAQRITGSVTDSLTNAPLGRASVVSNAKTVTTNARGRFVLEKAATGETLTVSYVGYQPRVVTITGGEMLIKLVPSDNQLNEVIVQGLTPEAEAVRQVRNNVMPVTVLTARDIENRASNLNELLARCKSSNVSKFIRVLCLPGWAVMALVALSMWCSVTGM